MKKISFLLLLAGVLAASCKPTKSTQPPEWLKALSIYEITPKNYSEKRNIAAITENISKIRSLYVSAIALTPVTPVDIMNSSFNPNDPYASVSFDELDKELGTEAELRKLVDEVHANKMKILLEFDISYTGVNHPWRTNHVDYYLTNDKKKNDLYNRDFITLNYSNSKLRKAILKSMLSWKSRFGIDGIILLNTDALPADFCEELSSYLKSKDFLLVSGSQCPDQVKTNVFDCYFNNRLYDALKKISDNAAKTSDFKSIIDEISSLPFKGTAINFSRNARINETDVSEAQLFPYYYKLPNVISILIGGIPLVLNGQEEPMFMKYDVKKPTYVTRDYQYNVELYRRLFIHRKENGALFSLENNMPELISDSEEVLAFERKIGSASIVLMANLTDKQVSYRISRTYNQYVEFFTRALVTFDNQTEYRLGPHQFLVLTNKH
ncbi:MAG: alpha-amylase family glycosyl hydrolase [Saprospiraceae bacterium]